MLVLSNKIRLEPGDATPDQLSRLQDALTLDNPKFHEAMKFGRWIGPDCQPNIKCWQQSGKYIDLPRGFLSEALEILGQVKITDRRIELPKIGIKFLGKTRPYQRQAIRAILPHAEAVLESGTGSGKTVIGLAIIALRKQPTIIFVHSKELLYQWAERIKTFLGVEAGLIGDGKNTVRPVTVAIINSARNRIGDLSSRFGQVVVDECHRVPSSMFSEVVVQFPAKYLLGLSATAFRHDGLDKLIHFYIGPIRHRVEASDLHESGAVLKPKYVQVHTKFVYFYRGDYQSLIKALVKSGARNQLIVDKILQNTTAGISLVVSDRVGHCRLLARKILEDVPGCRIKMLTGRLNSADREDVVAAVRAGKIDVLIATVQLIGEGFDCPGLDSLFLTTPIKAKGRLIQVVGRILRPAAEKEPVVWDFVDRVGPLERSAEIRRKIFCE